MGDVNDLHDHLKNLIDISSTPWIYGILWECSSQRRVLRFKDGYHRGSGKGKPKQVRIMGSCVTVVEDGTDYDAASEWFFKISMSQSFEINEDLPGHALLAPTAVWVNAEDRDGDQTNPYKWGMWERTKWARQFGIRTFLCLPFQDERVLELASTQIIPYYHSFEWIHNNSHLIHPIGTLTQQQQQKQLEVLFLTHQQQQQQQQQQQRQQQGHQRLLQFHRSIMAAVLWEGIRDADELNKEAVNEMKNRGKEKISDSKCSWTILTESSDRGTDRTFSCSHDYSGPS